MLDITLRQLEYFRAAATYGSISRAAQALHLAQPSLSQQLQLLELRLGRLLLVRTSRGLVLTDAGRTFLRRAEATLAAAESAVESVRGTGASTDATVTFGTFSSAHDYLLTDLIARFRAARPNVKLRVVTQNSVETADSVRRGDLEVGLVAVPVDVRGLEVSRVVWRSEAVYVRPADSPARGPITIDEVCAAPLILPEARRGDEDPTRHLLSEHAHAAGLRIAPIVEVDAAGTVLELVARGVGHAVISLPLLHTLGYGERLGWVSLAPRLYESFVFITRAGATLSAAPAALVDIAMECLTNLPECGQNGRAACTSG